MKDKPFCPFCGQRVSRIQVEGRQRLFCQACERPIYENPIPATCLVVSDAQNAIAILFNAGWTPSTRETSKSTTGCNKIIHIISIH